MVGKSRREGLAALLLTRLVLIGSPPSQRVVVLWKECPTLCAAPKAAFAQGSCVTFAIRKLCLL